MIIAFGFDSREIVGNRLRVNVCGVCVACVLDMSCLPASKLIGIKTRAREKQMLGTPTHSLTNY